MASWRAWCRGSVLRQLVDERIGARKTDPWDEPTAPVVTDTNACGDSNEEFEDYQEDDIPQPDRSEYWGELVHSDLMDANGG